MKKMFLILAILVLPIILLGNEWQSGTIKRVVDGDTMVLTINGIKKKVRLVGVDTLESYKNKKLYKQAKQFHTKPETILAYGKSAKGYAMRTLNYKKVQFATFGKDYYGRTLVWIKGFNYGLVYRGYATFYRNSPLSNEWKKKLLDAEFQAKDNKRGIWGIK